MCYEFDEFFHEASLAEQMRRDKEKADELKKQGNPAAPPKPAGEEERVTEEQLLPV